MGGLLGGLLLLSSTEVDESVDVVLLERYLTGDEVTSPSFSSSSSSLEIRLASKLKLDLDAPVSDSKSSDSLSSSPTSLSFLSDALSSSSLSSASFAESLVSSAFRLRALEANADDDVSDDADSAPTVSSDFVRLPLKQHRGGNSSNSAVSLSIVESTMLCRPPCPRLDRTVRLSKLPWRSACHEPVGPF